MTEKMFHTTKSKLVAHGKVCTAVSMQAKFSGLRTSYDAMRCGTLAYIYKLDRLG